MYFWYLMVALSSLLENLASVPFTRQWTLRISRAPKLTISDDAPYVTSRLQRYPQQEQQQRHRPFSIVHGTKQDPYSLSTETGPNSSSADSITSTIRTFEDVPPVKHTSSHHDTHALDALEAGFNTKGCVVSRSETWSASRVPFYAIISLEGVSSSHAALRIVSKALTVGVFAAGTAIFASAQLISISVAVTALALILGAGVFGRVIAMWMASEMMKTKPMLHHVVKTHSMAGECIESILQIDDLVIEVLGHVIVGRRVVGRYSQWTSWSAWAGILAGPFDIGRLAAKSR